MWDEGGQPAGLVALEEEGDALRVTKLCVAPGLTRRGIGSALVRLAIERAGDRTVRVGTGARNAPALALYERFGFVRVGEHEPAPGLLYVELERSAS